MPSPTTFESTSRNVFFSPGSPKRRLPVPRTTGKTMSRNSSTRSCSISVCASWTLPWTTTSPPASCLSLETASTRSAASTTVEFLHSGSVRVEEITYLGSELNLSANSPSRDGHASAKPSYVTRPSSSAAEARVSSSLNSSPSAPRSNSKLQPPYLKSSDPPGSSTTPSSETNSVTTILPMGCLPSRGWRQPAAGRRCSALARRWRPGGGVLLSNRLVWHHARRPAQRDLRRARRSHAAGDPGAPRGRRGDGHRAGGAVPDERPGGRQAPARARARRSDRAAPRSTAAPLAPARDCAEGRVRVARYLPRVLGGWLRSHGPAAAS